VFLPVLLGLGILAFAAFAKRRAQAQVVDDIPEPAFD